MGGLPADAAGAAQVLGFRDAVTGAISYLVSDPGSAHCAIIDPLLGLAEGAHRASAGAEPLVRRVREHGLILDWILETHLPARHVSAAAVLQKALGGRIVIGEHVCLLQDRLREAYGPDIELPMGGLCPDRLVSDREQLPLGHLNIDVLYTPGHTPACISYVIGDAVFVGGTLSMPDCGTPPPDYPGGNARLHYRSARRLLALPRSTRMFPGHDRPPARRAPAWETTVDAQRQGNIHVRDGISETEFVEWQRAQGVRPSRMPLPLLINLRASRPAAKAAGLTQINAPSPAHRYGR